MQRESSHKARGDFLEDVVALLHEMPGAKIEKRVRLPVREDPQNSREIDILISGMGLGYELRRAIECKNWSQRVGVGPIDEFLGKLSDVGIPAPLCAFVSLNGFTKGAIRRGAKEGLRLLTISGLARNGLSAVVEAAFQYVVYFLPIVEDVQVLNDRSGGRSVIKSLRHHDSRTGRASYALDNLWRKWVTGELPRALGLHHAKFEISQDPSLFNAGEALEPRVVYFGVRVVAAVVKAAGSATYHSLHNVETGRVEKRRIHTEFEVGPAKAMIFESAEEVSSYLGAENAGARLVLNGLPLPRLIYQHIYWPPTAGALRRSKEQFDRGEKPTFESVEGPDLSRAWSFLLDEPVVSGIPDDVGFETYPSFR